jgi:hypothetical protein
MTAYGKAGGGPASWFIESGRRAVRIDLIESTPEEIQLRASQNRSMYYLYLDLTGQGRHHCTCADWGWRPVRLGPGMFCRHIAAAAIEYGVPNLLLPLLARI